MNGIQRVRIKKDNKFSKINHEIFIVQRFSELLETETLVGSANKLFFETQIRYQQQFPNSLVDIKKYNGVDQETEGACSFVGFLNLCLVSEN